MAPRAIVVGSGPNGLAAAVTLARAGWSVLVVEGSDTPGGGCRTGPLTLPGFAHDVCASVHPLLVASPFFEGLGLEALGLDLCSPRVSFAHPLDGGRAGAVVRSLDETASSLGPDAVAYRRLFAPLCAAADALVATFLSPVRAVPRHPAGPARVVLEGVRPVTRLARRFTTDETRGILAGAAAHAGTPLDAPLTGAFSLLFATLAHVVGWPVVRGGSAQIVDGLVKALEDAGGRVETGRWVRSLGDLPPARAVLLDLAPRQLLEIAGPALPPSRRRAYRRFEHGPGVCKVDWALSEPVPWQADACRETATVHVGGTMVEVARSEAAVAAGTHPGRPFCIVAQPSVVDPSRAPAGRHTLWAYCHVPPGSSVDMTQRIEDQIERFAPGFRDTVLHRVTATAAQMEQHNPAYVGGDVSGGAATVRQMVGRPTLRWNPYRTGIDGVYLCSASTPPGGGVHGMCGYHAARAVLADARRGAGRGATS
jgi:phytoene dehydrogenase-like protein